MKLDLTEIQNKRRDTLDFDFEIDPASRDDFALLPWGEAYDGNIRVHARAFDANGYVRVDFAAEADLVCECTRCGKKIGDGCKCEPVAEEKTADPRLDVFRRLRERMDEE